MRGHARLGDLVHRPGADLNLDALAVAPRHRGVDASVSVRFGLADVILEPPRHGAPALVDRAKRAIAILFGLGDHAKAVDIRQPREPFFLFLHLAPDRMRFLGASEHLGVDAGAVQFAAHVAGDAFHHVAGLALQGDEAADDARPRLGVEHAKGQILQLLAHPLHAHASRERRVDVHRLARLLPLLVGAHRLDGAHVVQPVGELHQDHPQILGHRHEQLAEILGLLGLGIRQLQIGQLGHAIDQIGHFAPNRSSTIR